MVMMLPIMLGVGLVKIWVKELLCHANLHCDGTNVRPEALLPFGGIGGGSNRCYFKKNMDVIDPHRTGCIFRDLAIILVVWLQSRRNMKHPMSVTIFKSIDSSFD